MQCHIQSGRSINVASHNLWSDSDQKRKADALESCLIQNECFHLEYLRTRGPWSHDVAFCYPFFFLTSMPSKCYTEKLILLSVEVVDLLNFQERNVIGYVPLELKSLRCLLVWILYSWRFTALFATRCEFFSCVFFTSLFCQLVPSLATHHAWAGQRTN